MAGFVVRPRAPPTFSLRAWSLNLEVQLGLGRRRAHVTAECHRLHQPLFKGNLTLWHVLTQRACVFSELREMDSYRITSLVKSIHLLSPSDGTAPAQPLPVRMTAGGETRPGRGLCTATGPVESDSQPRDPRKKPAQQKHFLCVHNPHLMQATPRPHIHQPTTRSVP